MSEDKEPQIIRDLSLSELGLLLKFNRLNKKKKELLEQEIDRITKKEKYKP